MSIRDYNIHWCELRGIACRERKERKVENPNAMREDSIHSRTPVHANSSIHKPTQTPFVNHAEADNHPAM
jgi:hypothetical protein